MVAARQVDDVTAFWREAFDTYIGKSIVRVMGPLSKGAKSIIESNTDNI